jgi:hypothetical protein
VSESIKIEILGMELLFVALEEAVDGDSLLYEAAPELFEEYHDLNKQNFESEGGLTGGFVPLTEEYAARKLKAVGRKPIEQYGGKLFRALTEKTGDTIYDVRPGSVEFGTSLEYAAAQDARNALVPLGGEAARRYGDMLSKVAGERGQRLGLVGLGG